MVRSGNGIRYVIPLSQPFGMQDAVAGVPHIFVVAAVFLKLLRSVMLLYAHLPPRCTAVSMRDTCKVEGSLLYCACFMLYYHIIQEQLC